MLLQGQGIREYLTRATRNRSTKYWMNIYPPNTIRIVGARKKVTRRRGFDVASADITPPPLSVHSLFLDGLQGQCYTLHDRSGNLWPWFRDSCITAEPEDDNVVRQRRDGCVLHVSRLLAEQMPLYEVLREAKDLTSPKPEF